MVKVPLLDRIPTVGGMFFEQNVLVYIAFLLVPVVGLLLKRTTYGLNIRAAGENPAAARQPSASAWPASATRP